MERLLEFIADAIFGRTVLVTGLSIILVVALSIFVPSLTGEVGVVLVCVGFVVGLMWEGASNSIWGQPNAAPIREMSLPVTVLGLMFIGALIGGWASAMSGSIIIGAAVLLGGVAAVAGHRAWVIKRPIPFRTLAISASSLLFGLGAIAALSGMHHA